MIGCIYLLIFPNGKGYVGLTINDPRRRYSRHKAAALLGKRQSRLYKAWRKYGDPQMTILCRADVITLPELERLLIKVCGTLIPHGYNHSLGGEGAWGVHVSEETRAKLSAAAIGRRMSDAARIKMSLAAKGRQIPESVRAKMSAAQRGRPKSREAIEKQRQTVLRQNAAKRLDILVN